MIAEARRLNPDPKFQVGSMTELAFDDGHFHAICAWYSVIHIPDELLPDVFSEFRRVLRPGGWALVAFQVGEQPREFKQMFGEQVSLTSRVSDRPPNVSLCSTFQRNVAHTFTFDVRRRQPTACARASRGDVTALRRSRT
jgi:ubiquinone/menaquinone biosynthesis C-methylase UbiE